MFLVAPKHSERFLYCLLLPAAKDEMQTEKVIWEKVEKDIDQWFATFGS